jgi:hypothetical protein
VQPALLIASGITLIGIIIQASTLKQLYGLTQKAERDLCDAG